MSHNSSSTLLFFPCPQNRDLSIVKTGGHGDSSSQISISNRD